MSTPQFSITQYLDNSKGFTDEVRKTLFDKGILTKDYPDNNLVLERLTAYNVTPSYS